MREPCRTAGVCASTSATSVTAMSVVRGSSCWRTVPSGAITPLMPLVEATTTVRPVTWVFYAAYLHAQSTAGWRGTRAAWFSLLGYAAFLFNFVGVNMWISGLHSYAGV